MALGEINFSVNLETAPPEVAEVYSSAYAASFQKNKSAEDADRFAAMNVALAGWFAGENGEWEKRGIDRRSKVNVRPACLQPDGTYLVKDVDVFYANGVKTNPSTGEKIDFTPADISERVKNTNEFIAAGGQLPGMTKGHPSMGTSTPSFGSATNWRMLPGKQGMVRCDFVGVQPETFREWKDGKWTGLSAGLLADHGQKDKRFSHVALLGSTPQALCKLPQTIVYGSENMIAFSAEPPTETQLQPTKGQAMTLKEKLSAAFAAALNSVDFAAEAKDMKDIKEVTELPEDPELKVKPKDNPGTMVSVGDKDDSKGKDYSAEFAAINSRLKEVETENTQLKGWLNTMIGKQVKGDFSAYMDEHKRAGHQFDAESSMVMFESMASRNDKAGVEALKLSIKNSPKDSRVAVGTVFGAGGGTALNTALPSTEKLAERMTEFGVSLEEQKMGEALGAAMNLDWR